MKLIVLADAFDLSSVGSCFTVQWCRAHDHRDLILVSQKSRDAVFGSLNRFVHVQGLNPLNPFHFGRFLRLQMAHPDAQLVWPSFYSKTGALPVVGSTINDPSGLGSMSVQIHPRSLADLSPDWLNTGLNLTVDGEGLSTYTELLKIKSQGLPLFRESGGYLVTKSTPTLWAYQKHLRSPDKPLLFLEDPSPRFELFKTQQEVDYKIQKIFRL